MLEIEAISLFLGIVSLLANLFLIQYIRKNDFFVLKLILFSLLIDAIVSLSTIVTSSQRLLQDNETSSNPHRLFFYSSVPIWIFADILQTAFSLNFSVDRFMNFAAPIFYASVSAVCSSWLIFVAILTSSFVFSALLTYEVQKLGDLVGYNGTVCSFLREYLFNVYFDILFWICSTAVLLCMTGIILALVRSKDKGYCELLQNNSYFLFPNTLICVIRNVALVVSYYVAYWLIPDKDLLLSVARLLSTIALLILQPGSLYISLRWYNKHQSSKKLGLSRPGKERKTPKNSTAAAIVGPALMIDVATLSLFNCPVISLNLTSKEFMEQRAEKERSVSFYQIVRPGPQNFFMPATSFGDMYSDPFD